MVTQVRGAQPMRVMHAVFHNIANIYSCAQCRLGAVSRNRSLAHNSSIRGPQGSQAHQSHHCAVSAVCAAPACHCDVCLALTAAVLLQTCRLPILRPCHGICISSYRPSSSVRHLLQDLAPPTSLLCLFAPARCSFQGHCLLQVSRLSAGPLAPPVQPMLPSQSGTGVPFPHRQAADVNRVPCWL